MFFAEQIHYLHLCNSVRSSSPASSLSSSLYTTGKRTVYNRERELVPRSTPPSHRSLWVLLTLLSPPSSSAAGPSDPVVCQAVYAAVSWSCCRTPDPYPTSYPAVGRDGEGAPLCTVSARAVAASLLEKVLKVLVERALWYRLLNWYPESGTYRVQ